MFWAQHILRDIGGREDPGPGGVVMRADHGCVHPDHPLTIGGVAIAPAPQPGQRRGPGSMC